MQLFILASVFVISASALMLIGFINRRLAARPIPIRVKQAN